MFAVVLTLAALLLPRPMGEPLPLPQRFAISAIRTIHTAEAQYYSQFNRYATSLAELGPPANGWASASAADLIGNDLANGVKRGYVFNVTGNRGGYIIQAMPQVFNTGGSRTLYSDQTMVVHEHYGPEPATPQDPESK